MNLLNLVYFLALLKIAMAVSVCSVTIKVDDDQYLNAVGRNLSSSQCKLKLESVTKELDNLEVKNVFENSKFECKGTSCSVNTYSNYKCEVVKVLRSNSFDIPSSFALCD